MASKIAVKGSEVRCMYDDRLMPIFRALGRVSIVRASDVEFDAVSGLWVAVDRFTGREISRGISRSAVIADEIAYFERGF